MSHRQDILRFKVMPNGDIRGYRNTYDKRGASEWQITKPTNICGTISSAWCGKVYITYET